jgi:glutamyl-tRNA synthetase
MKTRIAPTPSGYLHIGNGFNFVLTWLYARSRGAAILLRVDDLDKSRVRPEYIEDVFRTLDWLGLDWDEGPFGPTELEQKWSQHLRFDGYHAAIDELTFKDIAFTCTLSRAQIAEASGYPDRGFSQNLPPNHPDTALRAFTENKQITFSDLNGQNYSINLQEEMKAFVLRRKDGLPAYQIASLVDDLDFDISLIVRGKDLVNSTAAQLWLAEQLERPAFSKTTFLHHDLLKDEAGEKLSKSAGADALAEWRARKKPLSDFYKKISKWLGLGELGSISELLQAFKESRDGNQ